MWIVHDICSLYVQESFVCSCSKLPPTLLSYFPNLQPGPNYRVRVCVFILSTLAWADCSTNGFYLMLLYNEQTLQIFYVLYLANGRSSWSFCSIYIVWRKSVIKKLWKKDKTISEKRKESLWKRPGDHFTKVIVIRKSKITLTISLRARIRAFH